MNHQFEPILSTTPTIRVRFRFSVWLGGLLYTRICAFFSFNNRTKMKCKTPAKVKCSRCQLKLCILFLFPLSISSFYAAVTP